MSENLEREKFAIPKTEHIAAGLRERERLRKRVKEPVRLPLKNPLSP